MKQKKIALLLDVDNVKIGGEAFNELYSKLNEIGDVVYCKFYGYNDRKHLYLSEAISKYGYETAPFMRFKKRYSQLDIRIVVDAIKLNYTKTEIDTYCIVAGEGDLIPLLVELKSCGRTVIDINTEYQEMNYHMFDAHIKLANMTNTAEVYTSKNKKSTTTVRKATVVRQKAVAEEPKSSTVTQVTKTVETVAPTPTDYNEQYDTNEEYYEETVYDNDQLSEILKDITSRYSELDFSNDSDMDKKVELIKDIETLIKDESKKGEGLNSKNADIRQIFVELQNIVDDMKSAI